MTCLHSPCLCEEVNITTKFIDPTAWASTMKYICRDAAIKKKSSFRFYLSLGRFSLSYFTVVKKNGVRLLIQRNERLRNLFLLSVC